MEKGVPTSATTVSHRISQRNASLLPVPLLVFFFFFALLNDVLLFTAAVVVFVIEHIFNTLRFGYRRSVHRTLFGSFTPHRVRRRAGDERWHPTIIDFITMVVEFPIASSFRSSSCSSLFLFSVSRIRTVGRNDTAIGHGQHSRRGDGGPIVITMMMMMMIMRKWRGSGSNSSAVCSGVTVGVDGGRRLRCSGGGGEVRRSLGGVTVASQRLSLLLLLIRRVLLNEDRTTLQQGRRGRVVRRRRRRV